MKANFGGVLGLRCSGELDSDKFVSCLVQILGFTKDSALVVRNRVLSLNGTETGLTFTGSFEKQTQFMEAIAECNGLEAEVLSNAPTQEFIDLMREHK